MNRTHSKSKVEVVFKGAFRIVSCTVLVASIFSTPLFSHATDSNSATVKSAAVMGLEEQIKALSKHRSKIERHVQRDLLSQLDKGGPDWQPIDSMVVHELDQEIFDYDYYLKAGQGSQLGEMHDQMVGLLAETPAFQNLDEAVLANMVLAMTAKKGRIPSGDRKFYLNKMRFQLGLTESRHLKSLIDEVHANRREIAKFDKQIANAKLQLQQIQMQESEARK